jgi:hypothetical protein
MKASRFLAALAVLVFLVSMFLPSVNGMWGIITMVFGVSSALFDPPWFIVWVANPIIITAFVLRMNGKAPVWQRLLPLIAVICGSFGLIAKSIVVEEAGVPHLVDIGIGFWAWLISLALFALASLIAVGQPLGNDERMDASNQAAATG